MEGMYERCEELEDMMAGAKHCQLPPDEQLALLKKVRNGHVGALYRLVDSCEIDILMIIEEYYVPGLMTAAEMLATGRQILMELAVKELGSNETERFFRFGEWAVREAILEKMSERNKISLWKDLWKGKGKRAAEESDRLHAILERLGI